jgi:hypothetical protein
MFTTKFPEKRTAAFSSGTVPPPGDTPGRMARIVRQKVTKRNRTLDGDDLRRIVYLMKAFDLSG